MTTERLQKILAQAGVASRRASEEMIAAGRVRVNGRVISELGAKADQRNDRIEVDGRRLAREKPVYIVLHKPRNVVSTLSDPEDRPTVKDYVKAIPARLYPVGRLDYATSGVLLLTNDGEFTQALLHPKGKVPKTYVVKLDRQMQEDEIGRWREGIELDDGKTLPADVRLLRYEAGKTWLEITLFEGRNNQIRRMADSRGYIVMRLARVSFAGIEGTNLRPGQWRALTIDEQKLMKKAFGVPTSVRVQDHLIGPLTKPPKPRTVRRTDGESAAPHSSTPVAAHTEGRTRSRAPSLDSDRAQAPRAAASDSDRAQAPRAAASDSRRPSAPRAAASDSRRPPAPRAAASDSRRPSAPRAAASDSRRPSAPRAAASDSRRPPAPRANRR